MKIVNKIYYMDSVHKICKPRVLKNKGNIFFKI